MKVTKIKFTIEEKVEEDEEEQEDNAQTPGLRRSTRKKKPVDYNEDNVFDRLFNPNKRKDFGGQKSENLIQSTKFF